MQNKQNRFWHISRWFLLLLVVMFSIRLVSGFFKEPGDEVWQGELSANFFSSVSNLRKNYAGEKIQTHIPEQGGQFQNKDTQKYEKTATVRSRSTQFNQDSLQIKQKTQEFQAVIQYEQNTGNPGSREIHLMIGIYPEQFDSFYEAVLSIGSTRYREITKIDKTNEFRQLNGRKASLEKNLSSLNELRLKGGAIADFVQLHEKILDIENQLQELGVELGNFDSENEFCTVKFSMFEAEPVKIISIWQRIITALIWTIQYYALLMLGLLLMTVMVYGLLLIAEKIRSLWGCNQ